MVGVSRVPDDPLRVFIRRGEAVVGMRSAGMPRKQNNGARFRIAGLTVQDLSARHVGLTMVDLGVVRRHVQTSVPNLVRVDHDERRAVGPRVRPSRAVSSAD